MSEMKCSDYLKELQKEIGCSWNAWMWLPLPPDEVKLRIQEVIQEMPRPKNG